MGIKNRLEQREKEGGLSRLSDVVMPKEKEKGIDDVLLDQWQQVKQIIDKKYEGRQFLFTDYIEAQWKLYVTNLEEYCDGEEGGMFELFTSHLLNEIRSYLENLESDSGIHYTMGSFLKDCVCLRMINPEALKSLGIEENEVFLKKLDEVFKDEKEFAGEDFMLRFLILVNKLLIAFPTKGREYIVKEGYYEFFGSRIKGVIERNDASVAIRLLSKLKISFPELATDFVPQDELEQYLKKDLPLDVHDPLTVAGNLFEKFIVRAKKVEVTEEGLVITMPEQKEFKEDDVSRPERLTG